MKAKDLIRLVAGKYRVTDGIWDYTIKKSLSEDGKKWFYVISNDHYHHLGIMSEGKEPVFEGSDKYNYPVMNGTLSLGGFTVHSQNVSMSIRGMRFIPKSSYLSWLSTIDETQFERDYNKELV